MIASLEPIGRGRYAGPCGWVDAHGDGEFVVALRGGELDGIARDAARGRRHRRGFRSRRRVGRDAAEAHADAASPGAAVTGFGFAARRALPSGPEHDHRDARDERGDRNARYCNTWWATVPIALGASDGNWSPTRISAV